MKPVSLLLACSAAAEGTGGSNLCILKYDVSWVFQSRNMYDNSNIVTFLQCRKSCLLQTATQFKLYHKEHIFLLLFAGIVDLLLEGRQNEIFEFLLS